MTLRISPSQIKRWRLCPRKTAFQVCTDLEPVSDGLPGPNDLGTRGHEMAEHYLETGELPDPDESFTYHNRRTGEPIVRYPGQIFRAGVHMLPAPGTKGLETEVEALFQSPATVWKGSIDLRYPEPDGTPHVGDHKFTGDLKWALSDQPGSVNVKKEPNYMGDDPQVLIYAANEIVRGADEVVVGWRYYQTTPARGKHPTKLVKLRLTRDQIEPRMEELEKTAELIQHVYQNQIQPNDLPAVPSACKAFGRPCEWTSVCELTDIERFRATMSQQPGNVDQRVAALLQGMTPTMVPNQAPPPPPPPPAAEPPPPPPPPPAESGGKRTRYVTPDSFVAAQGYWNAGYILQFTPIGVHLALLAQAGLSVRHCQPPEAPHLELVKENAAQALLRDQGKPARTIAHAADGNDPINPPEAPPNSPEMPPPMPPPESDVIHLTPQDVEELLAKGEKEHRAQIKKWLVQQRIVKSGCREGIEKLASRAMVYMRSRPEFTFTGGEPPPPPPPPLPIDDSGQPYAPAEVQPTLRTEGLTAVEALEARVDELETKVAAWMAAGR